MTQVRATAWRVWTSWRISWRELRHRPRDGVLVAALVALPVAILMAVGVVTASGIPTATEFVASQLGQMQAWIEPAGPPGTSVHQSPTDPHLIEVNDPSSAVDSQDWLSRDPSDSLPSGANLTRVDSFYGLVATAEAAARLPITVGAVWDPGFAGKYNMVSGRTPTAVNEAMISPALAERMALGLGSTVHLGDDGAPFTVVGVIENYHGGDEGTVYIPTDTLTLADRYGVSAVWYVAATPLGPAVVADLNGDGFAVFSRAVALAPAPHGALNDPNATPNDFSALFAGAALGLVEVILLAGAAFIVGTRRRQHIWAMLAATGADRRSLISTGVARGALLGALGGVTGVPVGLLAGWAWLSFIVRFGGPQGAQSVWGFHVVPWHAFVAAGFGVLAGALSSLVPAITASRVDVIATLRGATRPRRARVWPAVVGLGLAAGGVVVLVVAARQFDAALDLPPEEGAAMYSRAGVFTAIGALLVFSGAVTAVPLALRALASALAFVGVSARIAARDAARHASRTVPVVAAIAITVTLALGVVLDQARSQHERQENLTLSAPTGDAMVRLTTTSVDGTDVYADPDQISRAFRTVLPQAATYTISTWLDPWSLSKGGLGFTIGVPDRNVCPAYQAPTPTVMTTREFALDPRCTTLWGTDANGMVVGDAATLSYLLGHEPAPAALRTLAEGGAVAFDPLLVNNGVLSVRAWDSTQGQSPGGDGPTRTRSLDAIAASPTVRLDSIDAMITPQTAAALGTVVVARYLMVHADQPITVAQQDAMQAAVARKGFLLVDVSRPLDLGARSIAIAALIAVMLIAAAATSLALGLARAEARRDDFTLASVGAAPGVTKMVAAWQAAIIVFLSIVVGMATAIGFDLVRAQGVVAGPYSVPVLDLAAAAVLVPLVVGGVSWLLTRASRVLDRRPSA